MELQTDITKQDCIDFNLYQYLKSPEVRRQTLRWICGAAVWAMCSLGLYLITPTALRLLFHFMCFWSIFFILFVLVIRPWVTKSSIRRQMEKGDNKALFGPMKVSINSDGVAVEGNFSQYKLDWRAVEKIAVAEQFLYIYNCSFSAIIVPKRSFPNDAVFQEFVRATQEFHEQAIKQGSGDNHLFKSFSS